MIRPLFIKHQKELIAFANTNYGRDFVSQFGGKELKEKYPIVKVAPDGIHQHLGGNTFRAVFYPRSPYIKHFAEVLTMVDIAKENGYDSKREELIIPHFLGETRLLKGELPQIYLASPETFYPDPHPESTSVDGRAGRTAVNETFATIRAGAGTDSLDDNAAAISAYLLGSATSNQFSHMYRGFILFDTNTLPDNAIISLAVLSEYGSSKANELGSPDIHIVSSNPASNTAIVNADFTAIGTTSFGSVAYASYSTVAYNDFTLNASGIANISKTAVSKFGHTTNWDVAGTFSGTWASGKYSNIESLAADSAGTANDPKLVVTYTLPGGNPMFFSGGGVAVG